MTQFDDSYIDVCRTILDGDSTYRKDRTGTGTLSRFGVRIECDIRDDRIPLLTLRRINWKAALDELLWILSGSTNTEDLNSHIWDDWATPDGDLGPVYGAQWRGWGGQVDQIADVIESLRNDPWSRRHVVSAWNVEDLPHMALAPCHALFQFHVDAGDNGEPKYLNCQLYQRSADMFLGVPFNIFEYSVLTKMVAQQTGLEPGRFVWVGGDTHIYVNHINQVRAMIARADALPDPMDANLAALGFSREEFPKLTIDKAADIDSYTMDSFHITDYKPGKALSGEVAV